MLRMIYRASLHHTAARQRGWGVAYRLKSTRQTNCAVLFERPASHETRAAELQDWITKQRSALPALGKELKKTKDGPNAADLEVALLKYKRLQQRQNSTRKSQS